MSSFNVISLQPRGTEENHKKLRIVGDSAEIRTRHVPNANRKRCHFSKLSA